MLIPVTNQFAVGAAGVAEFDPLSLSPSLWLDASDTATITAASGAVSQWNDKSGNTRHAVQGTANRYPITGTRTINSLNVIDFDGTDDRFQITTGSVSLVGSGDGLFTVFAVVLSDSTTGTRTVISSDDETGNRPAQFIRTATTTVESVKISNYANAVDVKVGSKTGFSTGGARLLRGQISSSEITAALNGTAGTATATTGGTSAESKVTMVGANPGPTPPSAFWDGCIAEILVYPVSLASGDVSAVESYLTTKWGL